MKEIGGARLNLETEFFRKNNNLTLNREKKIRSVQIKSIHLLLMFLLVLALGYAGNRFCQFLLTWDRLNVRSFRLVNTPQYEKDQVDRILKLHRGNILTLNLDALKKQLLQLNEIAGVSVSRRLPSTVEVVSRCVRRSFRFYGKDDTGYSMRKAGPSHRWRRNVRT